MTEQVLTLQAESLESASGEGKAVLEKALAQVGFIPNMYARMVHSPGMLETYLDGYSRFRQNSGFTPAEQEVVFLAISRENGCKYCVSAHSMLAVKMSGLAAEAVEAIRNGTPIADPKLEALSRFTVTLVQSRGFPDQAAVDAFVAAGYSQAQVLEIVLAIAVKTLSNYANHLFETPLDDVFADFRWEG